MEIVQRGKIWKEVDGDMEFLHIKIILRQEEKYYYATIKERSADLKALDLASLEVIQIPCAVIWPLAPRDITIAPNALDCYIKRPSLLSYGYGDESSTDFRDLLLHEAIIYESLEKSPHPNLARYFGCIVHDGKIKGLCLKTYDMTLMKYLKRDHPRAKRQECWRGIRDGIRHLHGLGLVHGDLNPSNIMMDGDTPVIIDFDCCRKEGEPVGPKVGTPDWVPDDFEFAERRMDDEILERLWNLLNE